MFTFGWALLGLAALPAAAAIYLLRTRSRPKTVSSLMLWETLTRARTGGRHLKRLQVPLLLILELATLALLALAAAGPLLRGSGGPPLAVVLDDSFSMQAGGDKAPRTRAEAALRESLRDGGHGPVHLVLAGAEPRLLGEPATDVPRVLAALEAWRCEAPEAELTAATALAAAVAGPDARVLVLTDGPPPETLPAEGRVRWRAFGRSRPNAAIVGAARSRHAGGERVLVEVASYAAAPHTLRVGLRVEDGRELAAREVTLDPGARQAVRFAVPAGAPPVEVQLPEDGLPLDGRAVLLPDPRVRLPVRMTVGTEPLREALRRGLLATGWAMLDADRPVLLVTDRAPPPGLGPTTWTLRCAVGSPDAAKAYVGPFITDRAHPLCEGLDLAGLVWAADPGSDLPGAAIVTVGDLALVTERERAGGGRDIHLRLAPELSNVTRSPDWPILLWNVLAWRAAHLPGVRTPCVRLGQEVTVALPHAATAARVTDPGGNETERTVHEARLVVRADRPGLYRVTPTAWAADPPEGEPPVYRFAAAPLAPDESDLRGRAAGEWGEWPLRTDVEGVRPIGRLVLLAALAVLLVHLALVGGRRREGGP